MDTYVGMSDLDDKVWDDNWCFIVLEISLPEDLSSAVDAALKDFNQEAKICDTYWKIYLNKIYIILYSIFALIT